jgi:hypothetical protein
MTSCRERLELLETDLKATPSRICTYHDLPFAIFHYLPKSEYEMRKEIDRLSTRLKNNGKDVVQVSLAKILWDCIEENDEIETIIDDEKRDGFLKTQNTINTYMTDADFTPLPELLADKLSSLNHEKHVAFIVRAACLAPSIYQISQLMSQMQGKTEVPTVLFYPGRLEDVTGLQFMGMANRASFGNYRVKIY